MTTQVTIGGVACTIEKLASGVIRVSQPWPQFNPMHGPDTGGEHSYLVHPCQRHQYEYWNSQLPPQERGVPEAGQIEQPPWWSFGAGERAGMKE